MTFASRLHDPRSPRGFIVDSNQCQPTDQEHSQIMTHKTSSCRFCQLMWQLGEPCAQTQEGQCMQLCSLALSAAPVANPLLPLSTLPHYRVIHIYAALSRFSSNVMMIFFCGRFPLSMREPHSPLLGGTITHNWWRHMHCDAAQTQCEGHGTQNIGESGITFVSITHSDSCLPVQMTSQQFKDNSF